MLFAPMKFMPKGPVVTYEVPFRQDRKDPSLEDVMTDAKVGDHLSGYFHALEDFGYARLHEVHEDLKSLVFTLHYEDEDKVIKVETAMQKRFGARRVSSG